MYTCRRFGLRIEVDEGMNDKAVGCLGIAMMAVGVVARLCLVLDAVMSLPRATGSPVTGLWDDLRYTETDTLVTLTREQPSFCP